MYRKQRGFSMIEFAVVLGIMGIVLAALWGTVSVVRENTKRDELASQIMLVVNKVRDFYMAKIQISDDAGLSSLVEVTDYALRNNILLPEMIRDRTSAGLWVADTPWGPLAANGALLPNGGFLIGIPAGSGLDPTQAFAVEIRGLTRSSCIALAPKLTGGGPDGLLSASINGTNYTIPISPDVSSTACINPAVPNRNMIDLVYRLRKDS